MSAYVTLREPEKMTKSSRQQPKSALRKIPKGFPTKKVLDYFSTTLSLPKEIHFIYYIFCAFYSEGTTKGSEQGTIQPLSHTLKCFAVSLMPCPFLSWWPLPT